MALARPASTVITHTPAARPARPAPFSPADFVVEEAQSVAAQTSHIRRCNFRRVTALPVARHQLQMYDVDCTHPSYESPQAIGRLQVARETCASCTLPGVFRPDED
jgi:predicted acylesterase/phospholipase RssA